jgi:hypothetical protein
VNTFVVELFWSDYSLVTYYTVRWQNSELSETDKFLEKFDSDDEHAESLDQILSFIEIMGDETTARL